MRLSWDSEVRFHGACRPRYAFPLSGLVPTQHSLILGAGPYSGLTVHDQRSTSRTSRHMGRSWYPPRMLTGLCERSYQVYTERCLSEMASWWMLCILSRESFKQTVQPFKGIWCILRWLSSGGTKKVDRVSSYLYGHSLSHSGLGDESSGNYGRHLCS